MKIVSCQPTRLTAPYVRPRTSADHPSNGLRNCVWLRVETEDGLIGWGESYSGCYASEVTAAALLRLSTGLVGRNSDDPWNLIEEVRFRNRYWAMRGIGAQATSAIESALLDIAAQRQGQPLWRFLGAAEATPILAYASAGENALSPEAIHAEASAYAALGYHGYKLRCGGTRFETQGDRLNLDRDRVAAARQALGTDRLLFVDLTMPQRPAPWTSERVDAYLRALQPFSIRFVEEPALTYDVHRYREIEALGLIPPAGGESFCCPEEFQPFFDAGAYGVAQPDAAVVGGPASCLKVCRMAEQSGVPACLHAWSAGVGLAQNLHAGWSAGNVLAMEWPQAAHALATDPLASVFRMEDGYLHSTGAPGMGLQITTEWLERFPYQSGSERDF